MTREQTLDGVEAIIGKAEEAKTGDEAAKKPESAPAPDEAQPAEASADAKEAKK
jgi:hypothetical protein